DHPAYPASGTTGPEWPGQQNAPDTMSDTSGAPRDSRSGGKNTLIMATVGTLIFGIGIGMVIGWLLFTNDTDGTRTNIAITCQQINQFGPVTEESTTLDQPTLHRATGIAGFALAAAKEDPQY